MSDTTDTTSDLSGNGVPASGTRRRRIGTGLASMLMPELQQLANSLGVTGIGRMRKSELITAIQAKQGNGGGDSDVAVQPPLADPQADAATDGGNAETSGSRRRATRPAGPPQPRAATATVEETATPKVAETGTAAEQPDDDGPKGAGGEETATVQRRERRRNRTRVESNGDTAGAGAPRGGDRSGGERGERGERGGQQTERGAERRDNGRDTRDGRDNRDTRDNRDDEDGGGRRRNRRHRDRNERNRRGRDRSEPQVGADDVLVPVGGIIDILDNYAFIRTTGYLSGSTDVYVSMAQVRKYGLRRGDAVTGAVKALREDEGHASGGKRREKYNPLVRLDTVNGMEPDEAKRRPDFYKLTPLYPQERLRLETEPQVLITRVIDLVSPIGKGQRALIVSPPKAGKTMMMQAIANAITTNNPECHLMVVLVDERPEEVTDMQRSVKGEVISSTFDRHPSDHTTVAELSIERAKRLVELGYDVVVLLDGITRLGRAYNNATPASGRIMSGGIDATALYPPKKFLGAARNIENGGSLTILATALVETGSMGDTVIFEEFKGTGNSEIKLDRKIADKRIWPAVDVHQSSTRRDDLMMGADEAAIMLRLRRVLGSLEAQQGIELMLDRLKKTKTNAEFLMQIAKSTPGGE